MNPATTRLHRDVRTICRSLSAMRLLTWVEGFVALALVLITFLILPFERITLVFFTLFAAYAVVWVMRTVRLHDAVKQWGLEHLFVKLGLSVDQAERLREKSSQLWRHSMLLRSMQIVPDTQQSGREPFESSPALAATDNSVSSLRFNWSRRVQRQTFGALAILSGLGLLFLMYNGQFQWEALAPYQQYFSIGAGFVVLTELLLSQLTMLQQRNERRVLALLKQTALASASPRPAPPAYAHHIVYRARPWFGDQTKQAVLLGAHRPEQTAMRRVIRREQLPLAS